MQANPGTFVARAIQPSQHMSPYLSCGDQNLTTSDACVAQEQHARTKLLLNELEHTADFTSLDCRYLRIKDDVGPTFHQQDASGLWKRTARKLIQAMVRKHRAIGIGVRHVFHRPIHSDEPQAKAKGGMRLRLSHWMSQTGKQGAKRRDPQLLSPLTQRSCRGNVVLLFVLQGKSFHQTTVDFSCTTFRVDRQSDDQVDHCLHIQFSLPFLPCITFGQHLLDGMRWNDGFQLWQCHVIGYLALGINLLYASRHGKAPSCDCLNFDRSISQLVAFLLVSTSFFLSKWYWGAPLNPTKGQ